MRNDPILASGLHEGRAWRIRQVLDPDPPTRADADNLWTLICLHKRYNLGDVNLRTMEGLDEAVRAAGCSREPPAGFVVPLFLMDHSGLTVSLTPFGDPWDSGQVGVACLSKARWTQAGLTTDHQAMTILEGEIRDLNDTLSGNCWGFIIETRPADVQGPSGNSEEDTRAWREDSSVFGFKGDPEASGVESHWPDYMAAAWRTAHAKPVASRGLGR